MSRETRLSRFSQKLILRRQSAKSQLREAAWRRLLRFESLEHRLAPAVLTVTSLADGAVNLTDAVVTLRDALYAADNNLQVAPGGPTGSVTDEVVFQPGLAGVITLTQGQLAIRSDVTLTGPGANLITI